MLTDGQVARRHAKRQDMSLGLSVEVLGSSPRSSEDPEYSDFTGFPAPQPAASHTFRDTARPAWRHTSDSLVRALLRARLNSLSPSLP